MSIKGFQLFGNKKEEKLNSDDFKFLIKSSGRTVQRQEMDCDLRITDSSVILKTASIVHWFDAHNQKLSAAIMNVKSKNCIAIVKGSYDNFIKLQTNEKKSRLYLPVPKKQKPALLSLKGSYGMKHIQKLEGIEIFELVKQ